LYRYLERIAEVVFAPMLTTGCWGERVFTYIDYRAVRLIFVSMLRTECWGAHSHKIGEWIMTGKFSTCTA